MESIFKKSRIALLLVLCMMVASMSFAVDIYVDGATGDDVLGDGSAGNPYATINRGVSAASVNATDDVVLVVAGDYAAGAVVDDVHNVTVQASGGAVTVTGPEPVYASGANFLMLHAPGHGVYTLDSLDLSGASKGVASLDLTGDAVNFTLDTVTINATTDAVQIGNGGAVNQTIRRASPGANLSPPAWG